MSRLLIAAVEYLLSLRIDVSGVDVSKPLKPWKGALPDQHIMDEIRNRIAVRKTEPAMPTKVRDQRRDSVMS